MVQPLEGGDSENTVSSVLTPLLSLLQVEKIFIPPSGPKLVSTTSFVARDLA